MVGWTDPSRLRRIQKAKKLLSQSTLQTSYRYHHQDWDDLTGFSQIPNTIIQKSPVVDTQNRLLISIKSNGAFCVLGILALTITLGVIALAWTMRTTPLTIIATVTSPLGIWFFIRNWIKWLDAAPYCYRLLTSLGEDAENILEDLRQRQLDCVRLAQLQAEFRSQAQRNK